MKAYFVMIIFLLCPVLYAGSDRTKLTSDFQSKTALISKTALDSYVEKTDPSYFWTVEKTVTGKGYQAFIIHLRSQTWRTATEVNSPEWWHWLTVVKPDTMSSDQAFLYVGNGNSSEDIPLKIDPKWIEMALKTQSVVAEIRNAPNQPLIYFNDGQPRFEDNSVAYTWNKVMMTGDPTWSIRLPMVKSVVRGMDTVQELLKQPRLGGHAIRGFVLAGASKRGWTSWLTAAVDKRVGALVPLVIDVLNVEKFLDHHYSAYGFWAPALKDYLQHSVLQRMGTREFHNLILLEDPYFYRNRISIPKYLINASGDQFFLPDGSKFYFSKLTGENHIRYLPNSDHSMAETDAFQSVSAFYSRFIRKKPMPRYSWSYDKDGSFLIKTIDRPNEVRLWSANSPISRDFRVATIGKSFQSKILTPMGDGIYRGQIHTSGPGFNAFFVELVYNESDSYPLKFTTEVKVVPGILPFKGKLKDWLKNQHSDK